MTTTKKKLTIMCSLLLVAVLLIGGTLAYFWAEKEKINTFETSDLPDVDIDEPNYPGDQDDVTPGDGFGKDPLAINLYNDDVYMRMFVTLREKDEDAGPGKGAIITDKARADLIWDTIWYTGMTSSTYTVQENASGKLEATLTANSITPDAPDVYFDTPNYYTTLDKAGLVAKYKHYNETKYTIDTTKNRGSELYGATTTGVYCFKYNAKLASKEVASPIFDFILVPTDFGNTEIITMGDYEIIIKAQTIQASAFQTADAAYDALDEESK